MKNKIKLLSLIAVVLVGCSEGGSIPVDSAKAAGKQATMTVIANQPFFTVYDMEYDSVHYIVAQRSNGGIAILKHK